MKNIFVEGLQGSGKTTLLRNLGEKLVGYHSYLEGDLSPVELSWCSYMTWEEYQKGLAAFPDLSAEIEKHTKREGDHRIIAYTRILADRRDFYQYMERYEIYNGRRSFEEFKMIILGRLEEFHETGTLSECAFFQNIIEELLLYYCKTEEEILDFYRELFSVVKQKKFRLLYLWSEDMEGDILKIKRERSDETGVEMWFPLMINYLNESPYGMEHAFHGVSDLAAHFERRRSVELRIIKEILGDTAMVVTAKNYEIVTIVDWLSEDDGESVIN